ncbi:N-acetylmuramoyl-L-alanine amidase [Roseivivax sp. CAU 1753]
MSRIIAIFLGLALCAGPCLTPAAAQGLGGLARLDPAASAIEDARWGDGVTIDLSLSQGVPWRVFTLDGPPRLVVDFREVDWGAARADTLDRSEAVTDLRMGAYRAGWSRMVAVLAAPYRVETAGLRVAQDTGAAHLSIALVPSDADSFAAAAGAPRDPRWDLPAPAPVRALPRGGQDGRPLHVVLDPGHGGIDPGAEHSGATEADLMLVFARELKEVLLRAGGFEVTLTRDADVFVSLEARVAAAHDAGADLFISLHADALAEGIARGATVYTLSDDASDAASAAMAERHNRDDILAGLDLARTDDRVAGVLMDLARLDTSPRSAALAEALVTSIENATGNIHKRPLRQAGFSVLKSADIPSVLLEVGYLSTPVELKNLRDAAWRAGMAAGIRDGLSAWAVEDAALAGLRRQ